MGVNGKPRLLIIEDEGAVLRLMKLYLGRFGYDIDAYADGAAGWHAFAAKPEQYDLVISDLTLPNFDIEPLLPLAVGLNPAIRVMICTGRDYDVAHLPSDLRDRFRVLHKPFVPQGLATAVAEALSGSSAMARAC